MINKDNIQNAVSGTLMVMDRMIRIQGLELTLEQIREVNQTCPNFKKEMDMTQINVITEAWKGVLGMAILANKGQKEEKK